MAPTKTLELACQPPVGTTAPVLILGPAPEQLSDCWPKATFTQPSEQATSRYQLAIIVDPFAGDGQVNGQQLLAAARDRWASQVLVLIPSDSDTHEQHLSLLALGFTRRMTLKHPVKTYFVYGFSIQNYKTTPDWLNNKYWAHPERWNKR